MKTRLLFISIILAFVAFSAKAATPTITTSGSPNVGSPTYGSPGSNGTFTISGSALTANLVLTATGGVEISQSSGSGFSTMLTLTPTSGTVSTTTIYVRVAATTNQTYYSTGTIACSSSGASTQNVGTGGYAVNRANLTITANVPSKIYGTTLPTGSGSTYFTTTALQNGESVSSVSISYAYPNPNNAGTAVGTYNNTAQVSSAVGSGTFNTNNYNITYNTGTVVITKAALTITANSVTKTYGSTLTSGTGKTAFSSSGLQNGESIGSVTLTYGTGAAANAAVGTYSNTITASAATGGSFTASNYSITYATGTITVGAATLTITGVATKAYGATLTNGSGASTFTSSGLVNSENIGSVTVAYGSGAAATDPVGSYSNSVTPSAATGGTFTASNYNITYVTGTLTVTKATLTITANNVTKVYQTAITGGAGSSAFTATGLQNGETAGTVTITYGTGSAASAAAGTYTNSVVASANTGGTYNASNYTVVYVAGNIIVTGAPLTITANGASKAYGTTITGGTGSTAFTSTGLLNGENIGSVTITYGTGSAATANAGVYTGSVVPSAATGGTFNANNYVITYVGGDLTVTGALLTITANSVSKVYGNTISGAAGSTAFTSSGLKNGETIGSVTISYVSGASGTAAAGVYNGSVTPSAATGGTFTASNYNIIYLSTDLTVTPKTITLTSPAASNKVYDGTTAATITGTPTGVINGDVVTLNGTGTFASANVGNNIAVTASCTLGGSGGGNYTLTQPAGLKANITAAPLTITATGPAYTNLQVTSTTYNSAYYFIYSGTVNGETVTSVTLTPNPNFTLVTTGTSYTVTPSNAAGANGFNASNYNITYQNYSGVVGNTNTWTGNTNTLWSKPGNWSAGTVPTINDNVFIPNTTNKPTVDVTANCASLAITGSTTLTLSAPLTVAGYLFVGYIYNGVSFTIAGTKAVSFNGLYDVTYQSSFAINSGATVSFNANASVTNSSSQNNITNNGTLTFNSGCNFQNGYNCGLVNGGTINATSTVMNFTTGNVTNTGSFTATGGSITVGNNFNYISNSGTNGLLWLSGTTVNISGSNAYFTNTSPAKVAVTGCTFNMINGNSLTNSGTFTTQSGNVFNLGGSSGNNSCNVSNTGTYTDHGSTYTLSGQGAFVNNSGSGTMVFHGTTLTTNNSNGNAEYINNSSTFTADSSSRITFNGYASYINNSGTFNAGTLNSPCVIDLTTQASAINNSSTFNLGSTSEIINEGYLSTVNNNSGVFTLLSDKYGSATFGAIPTASGGSGGGSFNGTFNVQRYISGGASFYRAYRLLSSPVNQSSNKQGTGSYNIVYLNSPSSVVNANAVSGTTSYYGALTGGSGSGFTVSNANPTIYLYNESIASSNSTFVSGKFAGLTAVNASSVNVTSNGSAINNVSIPVGSGYLFYYIGNDSIKVTSNTRIPNPTTITAVGTINQNSNNGASSNTYTPFTTWWNSSTTMSYTSANPAGNSIAGFNLVGNPYPSAIDLNKLWTDNGSPAYANFYELVDINPNQFYVSYNANTNGKSSSAFSSRYIASGQGFFVQATATGQSLTFKEDQKIYNPALLNSSSTTPILLSVQHSNSFQPDGVIKRASLITPATQETPGLHLMLQQDTVNFDECGIYFHPLGADNYNTNDAIDLDGVSPKLFLSSFTADGIRTGINTLKDYTKGKRIKLFVKSNSDGIYHLNLEDMTGIDTINYKVYLIDKNLNDSLDMVHYKSYAFNFYKADTAAYHNRFVLSIQHKAVSPYSLITFAGQKNGSDAIQLNWNTTNEGNYTTFGLEKLGADGKYAILDTLQGNGSGLYTFNDVNAVKGNNIYRLAQNDIHGNITYAGPINITFNSNTAGGLFTVYPNPATDIINVAINSSAVGSKATPAYTASTYNLSGTVMDVRQVNTNTFTQDVSNYKAGIYIIELKSANGDSIGKAKFVKGN